MSVALGHKGIAHQWAKWKKLYIQNNLFKKRQNIKPNRAIKPTKDNANGENNLIGCFRSDRNKRNIGNGYFS